MSRSLADPCAQPTCVALRCPTWPCPTLTSHGNHSVYHSVFATQSASQPASQPAIRTHPRTPASLAPLLAPLLAPMLARDPLGPLPLAFMAGLLCCEAVDAAMMHADWAFSHRATHATLHCLPPAPGQVLKTPKTLVCKPKKRWPHLHPTLLPCARSQPQCIRVVIPKHHVDVPYPFMAISGPGGCLQMAL
jgi:hypothetical protein